MREQRAAARAATAPLSATLRDCKEPWLLSQAISSMLALEYFSLNLLQIFKCRNVAARTVVLNRSMSITGLAVQTLLEE